MRDEDCVHFLQWALPRLRMRWAGFRRVHGQVCKRLSRRLRDLQIDGLGTYRSYLEETPDEWRVLDVVCRIPISRFYRDKSVFSFLEHEVLPALAQQVLARHEVKLDAWSVGAASGEEPYSLALVWAMRLQAAFPGVQLQLVASDVDANLSSRARQACYPYSAIKNLPAQWREQVFNRQAELFCLKPEYRHNIRFIVQDVRTSMPTEQYDLVLCRNLVFTYYVEEQQRELLERIQATIKPGGVLVIGIHENLPAGSDGFSVWSDKLKIYRRASHGC
jgi:chemotaxis protein methyltransferase CheR